MSDFGRVYGGARQRICALVADAEDEALSRPIPACPGWTVKDLFAHVVGVARDMTTGDVAEVGQDAWTAKHIEIGAGRTIPELTEEWATIAEQVEGALGFLPPAVGGLTVGDIVTHEHDLRGALGTPGARDSDGVSIAADSYVRWLNRRVKEAAIPAVRIVTAEREWTAGDGDPELDLRASMFEILRATSGRRTKDEIAAFGWSGDPSSHLDLFSAYGYPSASLGE